MDYATVSFYQVKEAFHDPPADGWNSHSLDPGEWVFWPKKDPALEPH